MLRDVDAAVDGYTVYIKPANSQNVFAYYSTNDTWSQFPDCPTWASSIAVVNNLLTAIGGSLPYEEATNQLFSLTGKGESQRWEERFPPMLTKRSTTRAVCSKTHLIVAGEGGVYSSKIIEVMNTTSFQWTRVAQLRMPKWQSKLCGLVLCGDYIYSVHDKGIYSCSLNDLIQSTQSYSADIWSELTMDCVGVHNMPSRTAYISICGELVAVGGIYSDGKPTAAIEVYSPTTKKWKLIGHMETPRDHCLAAVLPNNSLVVVGGYTTRYTNSATKKVDILAIV